MKLTSCYSHCCVFSSSIEYSLGHVTCHHKWDIDKHDASSYGLASWYIHSLNQLPRSNKAWAKPLYDETRLKKETMKRNMEVPDF